MVRPPAVILTTKQRQILTRIRKFRETEGYFPSTREISQILNLKSSNTVFTHLRALIQKGYLKKSPNGRIIALTDTPHQFHKSHIIEKINQVVGEAISIPYFPEAIPAGFQAPAEDTANEMLTVDQYLIKNPNNTFALKVKGLSMEKAGIMPGDLILVEKRTDAHPGQIIIAHLPSGFTVKRLIEEQGQRFLKSEGMKEYQIRLEEGTEIWGIVIGIVRKY